MVINLKLVTSGVEYKLDVFSPMGLIGGNHNNCFIRAIQGLGMESGQRRPAIRPSVALPLCVASASTAAVLIRLASADPLAVAALRLSFATLVLLPVVGFTGLRDLSMLNRRDALALLGIGFCLAAHFALWITSLDYTTVAASVLVVSTSPIFVALFGAVFLREKVAPMVGVGIAVAMLGVGLIVLAEGGLSGDLEGILMALFGAIAVSGYLIGGRRLRQRITLVSYVFCVYSAAAAVLLGLAAMAGAELVGLPARDYAILLVLGIVPSHFGHTLYNYLLRFLDAKVIAVSTLGEPIISSVLAFMILGESPHPVMVVGAPLVLLGIYLTARAT